MACRISKISVHYCPSILFYLFICSNTITSEMPFREKRQFDSDPPEISRKNSLILILKKMQQKSIFFFKIVSVSEVYSSGRFSVFTHIEECTMLSKHGCSNHVTNIIWFPKLYLRQQDIFFCV